jgi:hypothetical protein
MSKLPYLACISALLLLGAKPQSEMFSKYKAVEAYEIRPGILAMPRYTEDGEVCEIGFEKRAYSPDRINIENTFSEKEIDDIVGEFVPQSEREPVADFPNEGELTNGGSYTRTDAHENVTISSFGGYTITYHRNFVHHISWQWTRNGEAALVITWTKRKCQQPSASAHYSGG